MNNETSKPIKILCILSFVVIVITSIPLLVSYFKGISPKYSFIIDLHVWAGIVFIIIAILRIAKTKIRKQR
jgi:cytochrome b561